MDLRSLSCSGEDRICGLSDSLIHHILSFMDMKYAVQTCVLSKRWSEIWISLPFLNFDSRNRELGFTDFVKMVFFLRDNSDIIRFRLFLDETFAGCRDADDLILAALRHNVQELDIEIDLSEYEDFQFPRQVFTCKSLRKLKLYTRGNIHTLFIIPESVSLHHLNSLILHRLTVIGEFFSLFSSCPLVELRLIDCHFGDDDSELNLVLTIDYPYLRTLELSNVAMPDGSIKLNAPNITSFICKDDMEIEYLGFSGEQNDTYGKRVIEFLGSINNVKDLKLSSGFLKVLSKALGHLDCQPPKFCNLQRLELKVGFTRGCMKAITYLLKISPNLKSLVLASKASDIGVNWEARFPCTLSKLRYVEIREVKGCDSELKLLGFLLENAVVLEEVALLFRSTVGSPERVRQVMRFRDQLRALPRASSSINIIVF